LYFTDADQSKIASKLNYAVSLYFLVFINPGSSPRSARAWVVAFAAFDLAVNWSRWRAIVSATAGGNAT
jgi:hypothetical protein